jgi:Uma2 family endonuclease
LAVEVPHALLLAGRGKGSFIDHFAVVTDAEGDLCIADEPAMDRRLNPSSATCRRWPRGDGDAGVAGALAAATPECSLNWELQPRPDNARTTFHPVPRSPRYTGPCHTTGFGTEKHFMATVTEISDQQYRELALHEPDRKWELWDGHLREKPGMTYAHNDVAAELGYLLRPQLDRSAYRVRTDAGRVYRSGSTYFIPDVFVFPVSYVTPSLRAGDVLEVYDQPLPLVVEVWSRSTGAYDATEKLEVYRQRGDLEIWFIHPIERTLTAWRRQPDGPYLEALYRSGLVPVASLPGITIDLDALLDG